MRRWDELQLTAPEPPEPAPEPKPCPDCQDSGRIVIINHDQDAVGVIMAVRQCACGARSS